MWKNSNIVYVEKKLLQILSKKQTNLKLTCKTD